MTYPTHFIFGSMNMNGSSYQQVQQDQFQTEPLIFNQYQPYQAQHEHLMHQQDQQNQFQPEPLVFHRYQPYQFQPELIVHLQDQQD